jgi:hypothetical protein
MKPKSIYRLMSVVLLVTGCVLTDEKESEAPCIGGISNSSTKAIELSNGLSSTLYHILDGEAPENAFAKQPHTMGEIISGKIICDNEFVDGNTDTTEQQCRIIIDTTDRGVGG